MWTYLKSVVQFDLARGHLSLQTMAIQFGTRNIRLRAISDEESISHKTVTPENIKPEVLEAEKKSERHSGTSKTEY